jgi:hypothetical protein
MTGGPRLGTGRATVLRLVREHHRGLPDRSGGAAPVARVVGLGRAAEPSAARGWRGRRSRWLAVETEADRLVRRLGRDGRVELGQRGLAGLLPRRRARPAGAQQAVPRQRVGVAVGGRRRRVHLRRQQAVPHDHLGFGGIVASETEVPGMFANLL